MQHDRLVLSYVKLWDEIPVNDIEWTLETFAGLGVVEPVRSLRWPEASNHIQAIEGCGKPAAVQTPYEKPVIQTKYRTLFWWNS